MAQQARGGCAARLRLRPPSDRWDHSDGVKEGGRKRSAVACAQAQRILRWHFRRFPHANPTDEGLIAQQRDRQIEEENKRRENEERVAQYNYFAARASNRSAWARAGMGY